MIFSLISSNSERTVWWYFCSLVKSFCIFNEGWRRRKQLEVSLGGVLWLGGLVRKRPLTVVRQLLNISFFPGIFGSPPESPCCMRKSTLKNDRYSPLVMQGFSNCWGLFSSMATPDFVVNKNNQRLETLPFLYRICQAKSPRGVCWVREQGTTTDGHGAWNGFKAGPLLSL